MVDWQSKLQEALYMAFIMSIPLDKIRDSDESGDCVEDDDERGTPELTPPPGVLHDVFSEAGHPVGESLGHGVAWHAEGFVEGQRLGMGGLSSQ